jgi:hypothetical protein
VGGQRVRRQIALTLFKAQHSAFCARLLHNAFHVLCVIVAAHVSHCFMLCCLCRTCRMLVVWSSCCRRWGGTASRAVRIHRCVPAVQYSAVQYSTVQCSGVHNTCMHIAKHMHECTALLTFSCSLLLPSLSYTLQRIVQPLPTSSSLPPALHTYTLGR